jgi:cytidine deaminase
LPTLSTHQKLGQSLNITFELLDDATSLAADEQALLQAAMKASANAYAPFSHFQVGCAVSLGNGEVMTGNNQENPAYPSSLCAERTVLYYIGSQGKASSIRKIAIRAQSNLKPVKSPVTPCGACRQVMLEYEKLAGTNIVVLMQGKEGKVLRVVGVGRSLLPFGFGIDF